MNSRYSIVKLLLLTLAVAMLLNLTACGTAEEAPVGQTDTEPSSQTEETVPPTTEMVMPFVDESELVPETEPPVEISMPEYELAYSGELKDIIVVEELADQDPAGLKFTVVLSETQPHIFTLFFNTDQGDLVTVLTAADGTRIPVAFQMAQIPEGLSENDQMTFFMAQEAVNEIVSSLKLK